MGQSAQVSLLSARSLRGQGHSLSAVPVPASPWCCPCPNSASTSCRRWFTIQSNQLVYQKKYKVGSPGAGGLSAGRLRPCFRWLNICPVTSPCQDPVTVVVDDLRLCTVKLCPDSERRFCFEVVSPSK